MGYATAQALVAAGANVVLACRSAERGAAAAAALAAATRTAGGGSVEVEALDLASLESARAFVRRWRKAGRDLDLLICNAGKGCAQSCEAQLSRLPQQHSTIPPLELLCSPVELACLLGERRRRLPPAACRLPLVLTPLHAAPPRMLPRHHDPSGSSADRRRLRAAMAGGLEGL